jgi:uncharacterized membrane protein YfcA
MLLLLFFVAVWAGVQNALAGGGSFVTLPALMLSGLDARTANIASTLALFPGQLTTGAVAWREARGVGGVGVKALAIISLAGGAIGAGLLLLTPSNFFEHLMPWLVLFATAVFAYGSFIKRPGEVNTHLSPRATASAQFLIAIYGGYFGGGIGFLMLAALTAAGLAVKTAAATKNLLAGVMNASAVVVFAFTPNVPWQRVAVLCVGAILGGYCGALLMRRVDEKHIRILVVFLGTALTIGLFIRGAAA